MATLHRSIAVSALFTLFGGPGIVLVLAPWLITRFRVPSHEPESRIVIAAALIVVGMIPLLESIVRFVIVGRGTLMPLVPTEHLVVSGLYRYVRNPMYVGVLTVLAGEVLLFDSRAMMEYLATVWLAIHLFVCFYEEGKLARTFPDEYRRYKSHVPRWLPRLTAWRGDADGLDE